MTQQWLEQNPETFSGKLYLTLDDKRVLQEAGDDSAEFLKNHSSVKVHHPLVPLVIDECQFCPDLFPALKEFVRKKKQPGQFLLTGSVRFTSRKAIRESLAGRILILELFPFILSELLQKPLPDILPALIRARIFDRAIIALLPSVADQRKNQRALETYLSHGGLPGLCFFRNDRLRKEGLQSIHQLILDRDLRLITQTRLSHETLKGYLSLIAILGWSPYSFAEVTRKIGISVPTQKSLLFALEAIYLIRRIPLEGKKGFLVLMEDQFEEVDLSQNKHARADQLLSAFYRNARAQFGYRLGLGSHWSSFWLNSGAHVPLVLHSAGHQLGFMVLEGSSPSVSQGRSSLRFLGQYPQGKVIFLNQALGHAHLIDDRTLICPMSALL